MIVRRVGGELLLFTQTDHAALAAEMLALWREDGLPAHPRRRELLLAVREHDNGWREADAAPRRRADGRPCDFLDLPESDRRELWDRGVRRWVDTEPVVARLILRHAFELHRTHRGEAGWDPLLESWDELDRALGERTGQGPEEVERDYPWLALADELSLRLCQGARGEIERQGRRFGLGSDELSIAPLPLAGATTFRIHVRSLPDRPYPDDRSLGVAVASARWRRLEMRIVRETGSG